MFVQIGLPVIHYTQFVFVFPFFSVFFRILFCISVFPVYHVYFEVTPAVRAYTSARCSLRINQLVSFTLSSGNEGNVRGDIRGGCYTPACPGGDLRLTL